MKQGFFSLALPHGDSSSAAAAAIALETSHRIHPSVHPVQAGRPTLVLFKPAAAAALEN